MMHEMMQEKEEEIFRASLLCLPERMLCAAALLLAGLRHEGTELFTEEKRKSGEGGGREDLKSGPEAAGSRGQVEETERLRQCGSLGRDTG